MDPVSIVGLLEGSIGLAVQCGSVAKSLNKLAGQYKHAKLNISTMVQNLDIMQLAWDRVGTWSKDYMPTEDDTFKQRLERFLETGSLVLDTLEEDLRSYDVSNMTFTQRSRLVWNESTLQDHQNRIRDQAQSMSLLLQAMQLPAPLATTSLLQRSEKQFMKSDESAFSIVPSRLSSRLSMSTDQTGGHDGIGSYESMVYRRLSFEDDLFTARAYKRNYRSPRFQQLRKQEPDCDHETITPQKDRPQNKSYGVDLMALPLSVTTVSASSKSVDKNVENLALDAITVSTSFSISTDEIDHGLELDGSSSVFDPYQLMKACSRGDNDRVKRLLRMRPEVPSLLFSRNCGSLNLCPIHATVFNGHTEVMETLLQHADSEHAVGWVLGHAVYSKRGERRPPLHLAVMKRNLSMVHLLLAKGASVNAKTEHGIQEIHLAAGSGSIEVLTALIEAGADVNCADRDGRQPLHYISKSRDRPDIIRFLAKRGASINGLHQSDGPTPLHLAREKEPWPLQYESDTLDIRIYLDTPVARTSRTATGLQHYISTLSGEALANEPSPLQYESGLDAAIRHRSLLSVQNLLRHGINPNCCRFDGGTGLHTFVLAFDTSASRDKSTDKRILQLLLEHIDLLARDQNGLTLLDRLFYLQGISDEKVLELARLFLEYLPEVKILEKEILISMVRRWG